MPSPKRDAQVALLTLAVVTVGCTVPGSAGKDPESAQLVCGAGKSFAGIEDIAPEARFDGVAATVAATRAFAGLKGTEHMSALIGVGDGKRLYVAVVLGAFVNGPNLAFAYEYGKPGDFAYQPLKSLPPTSLDIKHSLSVRRVRGTSWAVEIDGDRVADLVDLPESRQGLAYPHVFLSSTNNDVPCDNAGGFAFSGVTVLRHGGHIWRSFPPRSQVRAWPGYRLKVIDRRRFSAGSD